MTRTFYVYLHHWAGLVMAGFLICAGLTGNLLAFYPKLEQALNPQYYPTSQDGKRLDLASTPSGKAEAMGFD